MLAADAPDGSIDIVLTVNHVLRRPFGAPTAGLSPARKAGPVIS